MKKFLFSAVVMLSVGLNAQSKGNVGIKTTEPTSTLDVNGDVRVRSLTPEENPSRVVTVDAKNVLKVTNVSNIKAGSTSVSPIGVGNLSVGKAYVCNSKNYDSVIFVLNGAVKCSRFSDKWEYNGLIGYNANFSIFTRWVEMVEGTYNSKVSTFVSGLSYGLGVNGGAGNTFPLQVINDEQYKK